MRYLYIFLLCAFFSCENSSERNETTYIKADEVSNVNIETHKTFDEIIINDGQNTFLASIEFGEHISINNNGEKIYSKIGSSGKRKYLSSEGNLISKISKKDDKSFKLKKEDGSLIWKVKIKEGKIKIADNEEMKMPFQVKMKEGNRLKMSVNENEIGYADYNYNQYQIVSGSLKYSIICKKSLSAGVLAFDKIPFEYRIIIIAELASRNL